MTSGHASHQIGLDADIWLTPMPDRTLSRDERESMSAVSMLKGPSNLKDADRGVDPAKWSDARARLIRRAAQDRRVARIFAHPGIKQALCRFETGDRSWLRKVRPWWGHHYHFHVRIACPDGSIGCKDQKPAAGGRRLRQGAGLVALRRALGAEKARQTLEAVEEEAHDPRRPAGRLHAGACGEVRGM